MVASAENVLKSTENNSKSCEKPLNGRQDTDFLHTYLTEVRMLAPHALKGQKLLAQGSALGIIAIGKSPCKGKSFMYCLDFLSFCPYRATDLRPKQPRALPWAKSFCPFRACCFYALLGLQSIL